MYHPVLDRRLADIRYAEILEQATRPVSRSLAVVLAAMPLAVWIVFILATH